MKTSIILCAAIATIWAAPVSAHDFWIQPAAFSVAPQQQIETEFLVGHGDQRQRSPIPHRRIARFEAIGPDGVRIDLRDQLAERDGSLALSTAFAEAGPHMLVLETDNTAQNHLDAPRFNAYVADEGLRLVAAARERAGTTETEGSEIYRRCAKVIMRAGEGGERAISRRYGLALEIVPDAAPADGAVSARVFFQGRPLAGALVKLTDLSSDAAPVATALTDAEGRVRFALPRATGWLLNVVWSTPRPRGAETDFETFFSSLAFAA